MARKAAWEDLVDGDLGQHGKSPGTRWGRVFTGLLLVVGATFVAAYYLPLYRAHQKLGDQQRELTGRAQKVSERLNKTELDLTAMTAQRDQLQAEHDTLEREKKSVSERQERVRVALSSKLDKFVKKGTVAVVVSGNSLFVALDGSLVFMPQKVDVTPGGRALLCDIATTSAAKSVAVRDSLAPGVSVPPALAASYANPWALSAARAAAVAQALHDACAFPASELSATGNGSDDPLATELKSLKLVGDHVELALALR